MKRLRITPLRALVLILAGLGVTTLHGSEQSGDTPRAMTPTEVQAAATAVQVVSLSGGQTLTIHMPRPSLVLNNMAPMPNHPKKASPDPDWLPAYKALKLHGSTPLPYAQWSQQFSPEYRTAYRINEAVYDAALARLATEQPPAQLTQIILYSVEQRDNNEREFLYIKVIDFPQGRTEIVTPIEAKAYREWVDNYDGWVQTYFFEKQDGKWVNQIPHEMPTTYRLSAIKLNELQTIADSGKLDLNTLPAAPALPPLPGRPQHP